MASIQGDVLWALPAAMVAIAFSEAMGKSRTSPAAPGASLLSTFLLFELGLGAALVLGLGWAYDGRCPVLGISVVGGPGYCGPFEYLAGMIVIMCLLSPFSLLSPYTYPVLAITVVAFRALRTYRGG